MTRTALTIYLEQTDPMALSPSPILIDEHFFVRSGLDRDGARLIGFSPIGQISITVWESDVMTNPESVRDLQANFLIAGRVWRHPLRTAEVTVRKTAGRRSPSRWTTTSPPTTASRRRTATSSHPDSHPSAHAHNKEKHMTDTTALSTEERDRLRGSLDFTNMTLCSDAELTELRDFISGAPDSVIDTLSAIVRDISSIRANEIREPLIEALSQAVGDALDLDEEDEQRTDIEDAVEETVTEVFLQRAGDH